MINWIKNLPLGAKVFVFALAAMLIIAVVVAGL